MKWWSISRHWTWAYDYHSEEQGDVHSSSCTGSSEPKIQEWLILNDYGEESPPYGVLKKQQQSSMLWFLK